MTFQQMYEMGNQLLDKSGSPYIPEVQFDALANIAYNDWLLQWYRLAETNHEVKRRLLHLYKKYSVLNSQTINLTSNVTDFMFLLSINGKFRKDCNGVITYPVVNIRPAEFDDIDVMQNDPFNKGVDSDPTYTFDVSGANKLIKVFSDTVPVELSIVYLKTPQVINSDSTPSVVFEAPDFAAQEVVMMAVKKQEVVIENYQRYQAEQAELKARL